jgi:hypothetical protein
MSDCITCKKSTAKPMKLQISPLSDDAQRFWDTGDFSFAIYRGGAYTHPVGSPTGILLNEYNYRNYAERAKHGAILLVHNDDIEDRPDLFELVTKENNEDAFWNGVQTFMINTKFAMNVPAEPIEAVTEFVERPKKDTITLGDNNTELTSAIDDLEKKEEVNNLIVDAVENDKPVLYPDTAMRISEYAEEYGYTHHLQVSAEVRKGNLKSLKRDGKTYVYHLDEE